MPTGDDDPPWITALATIANFTLLIVFGALRDLFRPRDPGNNKGYASLLNDFQDFYTRRLYNRIQDCFNRPINSAPGAWTSVMLREFDDNTDASMHLTGKSITALNLASYNYLGFAESDLDVRERVIATMRRLGVSTCSSRAELGSTDVHVELERRVARFMDKEDAMVVGMGFATNSLVLPAMANKGDLILSDELNHSSIVNGARLSQAEVRVFQHNSAKDLECKLRHAISTGQTRSRRPFRKILVVTEGLFSMEGEILELPAISRVCKRYKAYLYVDEAHSIGALGRSGKGVREHCDVHKDAVDVWMGTFTKAFGSVRGLCLLQFIRRSVQLVPQRTNMRDRWVGISRPALTSSSCSGARPLPTSRRAVCRLCAPARRRRRCR
jgi:serine palmitoyltransferase